MQNSETPAKRRRQYHFLFKHKVVQYKKDHAVSDVIKTFFGDLSGVTLESTRKLIIHWEKDAEKIAARAKNSKSRMSFKIRGRQCGKAHPQTEDEDGSIECQNSDKPDSVNSIAEDVNTT